MLSVIKQHGRTIVCCMAAFMAFGIAFGIRMDGHQGFVQIVYERAMGDLTGDPASHADEGAVRTIAARNRPEIVYTCQKTLPKKKVSLDAMFVATDADGSPVAVEITDVQDASGKSLLYLTDLDRKKKNALQDTADFQFPAVGIYKLKVRAEDCEKKTAYEQYQIPVTSN